MNILQRLFKRRGQEAARDNGEDIAVAEEEREAVGDGLEHVVISEEEQRRNMLAEPDLILREELRKDAAALGAVGGRPGSEEETACARAVRDAAGARFVGSAGMQALRACRFVGVRALPIWLLISALMEALYLLSYALGRAGAVLDVAVTVTGAQLLAPVLLCFFGKFEKLPSSVSYNVVASLSDIGEHTVAIVAAHGSKYTAFVPAAFIANAAASALLLICGIIAACVRFCTADPGWNALVFALPAAAEVAALPLTILALKGDRGNGIDLALAIRLYGEFCDGADDGIKLMFACVGADGAAHAGARALIKAYPELANAEVICIDGIGKGGLRAIGTETTCKGLLDRVTDCADKEAASVARVERKDRLDVLGNAGGSLADAFAAAGACTVTISSASAVGCADADVAYRVLRRTLNGLITTPRRREDE